MIINDRMKFIFKPITRRQILDSSKLKEFADDNFKFDKNGRSYHPHSVFIGSHNSQLVLN